MISRHLTVFAFLVAFLVADPASARWYEASSDNFVIYADDSEKDIREFAQYLERYHAAMELLTGREVDKPSPSNRVTIFAVGGERDIRRLTGSRFVAGFYVPRAGASRAFVQDIRNRNGNSLDFSMTILLHEYAHHFLLSQSRFAMPRWLNEGAAEFFASASFERDGSVWIGRPAEHRSGELFYAANIKVPELLTYGADGEDRRDARDAFYGRSWLLYHYLTFADDRKGQLQEYQRAIVAGEGPLEAGRTAFGDLDRLQDDLDSYLRQRRINALKLPPEWISIGPIKIRELPEGEAAMMDLRIRSQRGVDRAEATELVIEARRVAAQYPNDPGVLTALAEAEYDVGEDDAAIRAADAAIALDPTRANAYVQKGYAMFRKAGDAEDEAAAYDEAMAPFAALNAIENDHPLPLIYYYRSYAERGAQPPENARHALERAAELAPFDQALWFNVAMMQLQEGKIELARQSLQPLAGDPHGSSQAEQARRLLESLEDATEGKPVAIRSGSAEMVAAIEDSDENDGTQAD
ncbi:hypothetical protein [Erythrobacter sp.]|jgi:Flp pilus assembly protein TadD|uniref:hypothetical protein n=1 Tax=Erythrobacter sp. TaxID=1042 RepID=UPI002E9EDA62|nr:hypothetical protein [Erythrobacter sp.]